MNKQSNQYIANMSPIKATVTEGNNSNIRRKLRHNSNTKLNFNSHRNELQFNNGYFPDLAQDILRKNGGMIPVLWHAKPPASTAMVNISFKRQHYMTGLQYK